MNLLILLKNEENINIWKLKNTKLY